MRSTPPLVFEQPILAGGVRWDVVWYPSRVRVALQGASGLMPEGSAFTWSEVIVKDVGPGGTGVCLRGVYCKDSRPPRSPPEQGGTEVTQV